MKVIDSAVLIVSISVFIMVCVLARYINSLKELQPQPEQACLQIPVEHGSAYIVLPKEEICNNYCKEE